MLPDVYDHTGELSIRSPNHISRRITLSFSVVRHRVPPTCYFA